MPLRIPISIPSPTITIATATIIKFTPETVLATLTSYSNDWQRALDFYHYVSSPPHNFSHTPTTLSATIDILAKHFEFALAFSLLQSSSISNPSPSFRSLFNRLAAAHLVSDAIDAYRMASSSPFHLNDLSTYHLLIDALCDHRHVQEAQNLAFKDHPPFPADTKIHNMILRGWLKIGHFRSCREFWLEMERKDVKKDLHSYSIYMDFLSKSGKRLQSVKLYKELIKQGWKLDVVVYNVIIQADGLARGADQ